MATYQIKPGDTLSGIAQRFGYGSDYMSIAKANNIANPNVIRAGSVINIPDRAAPGQVPASAPVNQPSNQPVQSAPTAQPAQSGAPDFETAFRTLYPGWDRASALADYNAGNWRNKAGAQQFSSVVSSPGSSSGIPSFSMPTQPTIDLSAIYEKALSAATSGIQPEIDTAQGAYDAVQARIQEKRKALADAEAQINDNPYYSEATRTGRIAKLRMAAQDDIGIDEQELAIAQNRVSGAQNKLTQAKADAQVKLNIANQQYNIQSDQYQRNLTYFSNLLTSGALNSASGEDIGQIAQATGMSTSMINSIITASKEKNKPKPELKTADDGTNQYVVAIDPNTGKVISTEIIAASKPKEATQADQTKATIQSARSEMESELKRQSGTDGKVSPSTWLSAMQAWVAEVAGQTEYDFVRAFSRYVNPSHASDYRYYDAVFNKGGGGGDIF